MGGYDPFGVVITEEEKQTRLLEQLLAEVKCLTECVESVEKEIVRSTRKISGDMFYPD